MEDFLRAAVPKIPTLVGLKFTSIDMYDLGRCLVLDDERIQILFGGDEVSCVNKTVTPGSIINLDQFTYSKKEPFWWVYFWGKAAYNWEEFCAPFQKCVGLYLESILGLKNLMIWNTRDSVSSDFQRPHILWKMLRYASYFQLSSQCLEILDETVSRFWYLTWNTPKGNHITCANTVRSIWVLTLWHVFCFSVDSHKCFGYGSLCYCWRVRQLL